MSTRSVQRESETLIVASPMYTPVEMSQALSRHVTALRCFRCGEVTPPDAMAYTCKKCVDLPEDADPPILDVQYDYEAARAAFPHRARAGGLADMFRYEALLPIAPSGEVLAVGGTALVPAPRLATGLGLAGLYLKDETRNPTRSLKDRATAVAVTMALAQGRRPVFCASAGNAAISLAGFAAHAALECHVFVPREASRTRLAWLRRYGADLAVSAGNYDQAFQEAESLGRLHGWYSRNCAYNPFLVEGKKTAGFEIAEQLDWRVPDFVVAPVGDGCTLAAIGKAFRELRTMGVTSSIPRLVGVQSEAVQPVVSRFGGRPAAEGPVTTNAASIAVRRPRNVLRLLEELRASDGVMYAVSDREIADAQRALAAKAGIVAEFTSAATLAGLLRLAASESLAQRVAVLVITGGRVDGDE